MTTKLWPSSDYAARCDACGGALASAEPRVREDEPLPGARGKRSWHPDCYDRDPEGAAKLGPPAVARMGPRSPRVQRGPSGPIVTPGASAPGTSTPAPSVISDWSVTVERVEHDDPSLPGYTLIRVARLRLQAGEIPTISDEALSYAGGFMARNVSGNVAARKGGDESGSA